MDDITPEWKSTHPVVTTPDMAACMVFNSANPNAFAIPSTHIFEDYHAGFSLNTSLISSIFTPLATENSRVGYKLVQEFSCCNRSLGTAEI
jgi:hypothetical protein